MEKQDEAMATGEKLSAKDAPDALLVETARLYYEQGLTQQEIAEQLNIHRLSIVKMLRTATDRGIVQIRVVEPDETFDALKQKMQERFEFEHLEIVPTYQSSAMRSAALGSRAAKTLMNYINPNDIIGLGWGASVYSLVKSMPSNYDLGLQPTWVPLIGSLSEADIYFQVNEFASQMQKKLGGLWRSLNVPALLDSPLVVEALKADERIRRTTDLWSRLSIAVFGLGAIDFDKDLRAPSTLVRFLTGKEKNRLLNTDAKGDILARFFNAEGKICDMEYDSCVFAVRFEEIRNTPVRFAIAGGEAKAQAVYTALRNKLINVLVTDEASIRRVLEIDLAENGRDKKPSVMLP